MAKTSRRPGLLLLVAFVASPSFTFLSRRAGILSGLGASIVAPTTVKAELSPPLERVTKRYGEQIQGVSELNSPNVGGGGWKDDGMGNWFFWLKTKHD